MSKTIKISELFGADLALLLSKKLRDVNTDFKDKQFISEVAKNTDGKTYTQRIEIIAGELYQFLPQDYPKAIAILMKILGPENTREDGMFRNYYWILPIGKFIENYGLDHYDLSIKAIEEVTKRNTGEYAIRPFIRKDTNKAIKQMRVWAQSDNFHLRRLASEGLRPKLPWATKLTEFIETPEPVFNILELLKEDEIKFVQKSVANHLTDYLKVNPEPTRSLIERWRGSQNKNTQWIIKHATRKLS